MKGICASACSHIGNSRENHEDNYLLGRDFLSPEQVQSLSKTRKLLTETQSFKKEFCVAVSDGMGGHESGELASLLTVQYLAKHSSELIDSVKRNDEGIVACITELNRFVCEVAKQNCEAKNMGATLCGIVAVEQTAYCFNVGDSRMYQYSQGLLRQITVDNTEGQRLLNLGLLSEEEVASFPKKKAIYKYIGKQVELIPDIYRLEGIDNGTLLLLCSDGLSDALTLEEIQELLSKQFIKTEDKGKLLVEMAVERNPGAGDNITLIIVEY